MALIAAGAVGVKVAELATRAVHGGSAWADLAESWARLVGVARAEPGELINADALLGWILPTLERTANVTMPVVAAVGLATLGLARLRGRAGAGGWGIGALVTASGVLLVLAVLLGLALANGHAPGLPPRHNRATAALLLLWPAVVGQAVALSWAYQAGRGVRRPDDWIDRVGIGSGWYWIMVAADRLTLGAFLLAAGVEVDYF